MVVQRVCLQENSKNYRSVCINLISDIDTYPRRVLGSGAKAGLNVVLGLQEKDLEYLCRGPVQGFKIILHIPGEIPRVGRHYFRVPLKQEVLVAVKPQMITTSHTLNQYRSDR